MKSTGIVRKIDDLGRVVIPKELRRTLDIDIRDEVEVFVEDNKIILKKCNANKTCQVTGQISRNNLSLANGRIILSPEGAKKLIREIEYNI
ncbi:AbrB/MazE/SpoVT family DNA-binding domain-containing protein [Virgibacillus salexigens]|uniref:AbrB/MazE/SpoVT family DNA-binding domain-containing protein n=1 Tax=Virgibacillus salexigens TaxID=61016 RepID=UPI00190C27C9|nr:AbrB/MazE/SpoVT family DNA-binding domain-containing protein [Virgibacillus salexigens]